ncbi:MAG: alpha/beta fold hydrolase [Pyrinomonadaceae bacterium]
MPHFIRGQIRIAYDDVGSGAPVVLLHGFPFNRSMWTEQSEFLKNSYRLITADLRGHGETNATEQPATMNDMACDVCALLDSLGIEKATVGGLSMGGYVTLAFYRSFPDRVNALVLADTRAGADTEEAKAGRREQAERALAEGVGVIVEGMLPRLLSAETVGKRPEVVKRLREMMLQTSPAGAAAALRGMAVRADQTMLLPLIAVPTQIIVGREDAITPVTESEKMAQSIPEARLRVIPGAGHVSNIEQATDFGQTLGEFLRWVS